MISVSPSVARIDLDKTEMKAVCALVSIHAPAWGATYKYIEDGKTLVVSIHAPAWGATC